MSEKDKYHMISLICGILKNDKNELFKINLLIYLFLAALGLC